MAKREVPTRGAKSGRGGEKTKGLPARPAAKAAPRARRKAEPSDAAAPPPRSPVLIAGVGASAGGLEAFSQLLEAMPPDPNLAIVLVQHLAPNHESALPLLLSARTTLRVVQAEQGMVVEPNHVYVIPPNVQLTVENDVLHLAARPTDRSQYTPIDRFLHSLAESAQERAVGIILSGTASDGTVGVREIKAVGGITIAQDPDSARYDGMPRAAIGSGFIDLVLTPPRIAEELVAIAQHPLSAARAHAASPPLDEPPATIESQMDQVFSQLRTASGVDFRRYKRPTIERRLQRRMVLQKMTRLADYVRYMRQNPGEVQALYQDILIHVTRFFRDGETYAALGSEVFRDILARQHDEQPIRIWVAGCSTGEEAYSVAIIALECLGAAERSIAVQVFATDVSDQAIEQARAGVYAETIATDVSPDRLRRFFTKVENGYRINKAVREMCVFARQDLTRDPPFSKLDLIMCRNVLIYLGAELQQRLIGVFHYALKPDGFLVLGTAETIGANSDIFMALDRRHRIYQKRPGAAAADVQFQLEYGARAPTLRQHAAAAGERDEVHSAESEATRLIQERYAPPGVIVDDNLNVVQFRGQTGRFLEPAPGEPSVNLLKMVREGLLHGVREALQQARRSKTVATKRDLRVRANGGWKDVVVEVTPLMSGERVHFLVLFDDVGKAAKVPRPRRGKPPADTDGDRPSRRVARLQQELASSREYLQSIIQDLEAANEEMQSANEEVLSANEELQSTNEELDTAKEELQSTNEELNTVNEELHGRNDELNRLNSDLVNLLSSVQIAIVIVASDLRIRRFTPMAEQVLNLIASDIGRPIGHIKPNIDCPNLEDLITRVIDTVTPCEQDVHDLQGNLFSLRIRPYKSLENRIDGAVLALFDQQGAARRAASAERVAATLSEMIDRPMLLLDAACRVRHVNQAFAEHFAISPGEAQSRSFFELRDGAWNLPALRQALEASAMTDGVPLEQQFTDGGAAPFVVRARHLGEDGGLIAVLLEEHQPSGVSAA